MLESTNVVPIWKTRRVGPTIYSEAELLKNSDMLIVGVVEGIGKNV